MHAAFADLTTSFAGKRIVGFESRQPLRIGLRNIHPQPEGCERPIFGLLHLPNNVDPSSLSVEPLHAELKVVRPAGEWNTSEHDTMTETGVTALDRALNQPLEGPTSAEALA